MFPSDDKTKKIAESIRLSGKTIYEWKEDCEIFLRDKLDAEKNIFRLDAEAGREFQQLLEIT